MQSGDRWLAACVVLCACEGRPAAPHEAEGAAVVDAVTPAATASPAIGEPPVAVVVPGPSAPVVAPTSSVASTVAGAPGADVSALAGAPVLAAPAPGQLVMHPILRHRGQIEVAPEADDGDQVVSSFMWRLLDDDVVVDYDSRRFVVFTTGAPAEPPEAPQLRDLPVDGPEPYLLRDETGEYHEGEQADDEIRLGSIEGRWPEALFVTALRTHPRTYDRTEVYRWDDGWGQEDNSVHVHEDLDVRWDYVVMSTWVDGGVLGLRDLRCGSEVVSCDDGVVEAYGEPGHAEAAAALKRAFRGFKPLALAHGGATALPRLPKQGDLANMHTTTTGDVLIPGPGAVQRWSLARKQWRTLPLPDGSSPWLVGDDPAHLYALACTDRVASLARLVGDAFVADALPSRACGWDLEIERTGALWALYEERHDEAKPRGTGAVNPLWRRAVGGAWEPVSLAPLQLAADAGGRWISDGLRWRLDPSPGLVHLVPDAVVAVGPGDVFISATVVETGDSLILRDRPLPTPMIDLAPTQIASHVYEVGEDTRCVPQHLVLGTFDRDVALAEVWPALLAELKGTPGLRLYEVPGVGDHWRLVAMIDDRPLAPAGKRAALTALRERLLTLAPDLPQPQCGLPATPRREHAIGAPAIEPAKPEAAEPDQP